MLKKFFKKNNLISILVSLTVFLILLLPIISMAAQDPASSGSGLVPCTNSATDPCDFNAFMRLINNIINFILKYMAVPIAALGFTYAGFELVTSGGSTEKRGVAKKVFTNTALGLACVAGAWLIVKTLLSILGYDVGWIFNIV